MHSTSLATSPYDTSDYLNMRIATPSVSHLNEINWPLRISLTEFDMLDQPCTIRVTGQTHIGGVMFQLVEYLAANTSIKNDWSDFALWWPAKKQWLKRTKMTLDQYGVQADAILHFTRIHKPMRIQLPDLQIIELQVDYSVSLYMAVKHVCKELGIRHAEECSLIRADHMATDLDENSLLNVNKMKSTSKLDVLKSSKSTNHILNSKSVPSTSNKENDQYSMGSSTTSTLNNSSSNNSSSSSSAKCNNQHMLIHSVSIENNLNEHHQQQQLQQQPQLLHLSPIVSTQFYLNKIAPKYKSIFDKTRPNLKWLDSSKSLMEQHIAENDLVQLRFKYFAFHELNAKHDSVRINQIYEQAKWSILTEEIDCTEQELINFAALQLQIQLQTKSLTNSALLSPSMCSSKSIDFLISSHSLAGSASVNISGKQQTASSFDEKNKFTDHTDPDQDDQHNPDKNDHDDQDDDDVDTALNKLEKSLDVVPAPQSVPTKLAEQTKQPILNSNNNNNNNNNSSKPPIQRKENQIKHNVSNEIIKSGLINCDLSVSGKSVSTGSAEELLCEDLFLMKQQKYTFKKYKSYYFVLSDTHYLSYYKSRDESHGRPIDKINLKGCELVPDVNVAGRKFGIQLRVPTCDGMTEMSIRCSNEESYAQWMSACKLASRSKSISDASFKTEVNSILNLLSLQQQQTKKQGNLSFLAGNSFNGNNSDSLMSHSKSMIGSTASFDSSKSSSDNAEVQASNLLPLRMLKKYKLKQLNDRILEAYSTISDLDMADSKWRYIKEWQGLPTYGISYFCVKIKGSRFKEDIIGVACNRLLRISPDGETIKTWRFNTMKSWNVNWEIKQFEIIFDEEILTFTCVNCDPKILHEFIGGYIFVSLRSIQDKSENIEDSMFFKLTERR